MPVPNTINDLSTTADSNSPGGGENPFPELDNHIRKGYSFIALLRDLVATKLSTSSVSAFIQTLFDDTDAATARNTLGAVGKTGDETVAGVKTFSSSPVVPTATAGDNSTKAASTAYVDTALGDASTTVKGKVQLATGAEATTGTNALKAVTPSTLRSGLNASGAAPVFAPRAWVLFNGFTGDVIAGGNVSGVAINGPGNYTITFTTPMPDANYAMVGSGQFDETAIDANVPIVGFRRVSGARAMGACLVSVIAATSPTVNTSAQYVHCAFFR